MFETFLKVYFKLLKRYGEDGLQKFFCEFKADRLLLPKEIPPLRVCDPPSPLEENSTGSPGAEHSKIHLLPSAVLLAGAVDCSLKEAVGKTSVLQLSPSQRGQHSSAPASMQPIAGHLLGGQVDISGGAQLDPLMNAHLQWLQHGDFHQYTPVGTSPLPVAIH